MKLTWMPSGLAQADLSSLTGLEADVVEQAALVGAVYGFIILLGLTVLIWFLLRLRTRPLRWRDAVSRLSWRPWSLCESRTLLLILAGVFLLSLLLRPWLGRLAAASGLTLNALLVILQSVLFHWAGLAAVGWMLVRRRLPWRSAFGLVPANLLRAALQGVLILLGTMPLLVVATILYNLVLQLFGYQATLQDVAFIISDETSPWVRAYFIFLAVALAPLFEEILFRGILLPALAKRYGVPAAVVAVSLLFAGIHGHVPSLVPLFILSTSLCLAYVGTGSLAASIAMHALFNGVTLSLLFAVR